ncbi:uncharacterized protein LOC125178912 [Hyalella azteca]|uniref:Uncharacterized protein LOC125178912 n=1 Tax=Hyalella azteca TaxID=294128 RepID=A0A979FTG4_HYAAZ|nr:uncharacterized protein LOC125178912 [Hyalella azteca]
MDYESELESLLTDLHRMEKSTAILKMSRIPGLSHPISAEECMERLHSLSQQHRDDTSVWWDEKVIENIDRLAELLCMVSQSFVSEDLSEEQYDALCLLSSQRTVLECSKNPDCDHHSLMLVLKKGLKKLLGEKPSISGVPLLDRLFRVYLLENSLLTLSVLITPQCKAELCNLALGNRVLHWHNIMILLHHFRTKISGELRTEMCHNIIHRLAAAVIEMANYSKMTHRIAIVLGEMTNVECRERRCLQIRTLRDLFLINRTGDACPICQDVVLDEDSDYAFLPNCDHIFCKPCIRTWMKDQ